MFSLRRRPGLLIGDQPLDPKKAGATWPAPTLQKNIPCSFPPASTTTKLGIPSPTPLNAPKKIPPSRALCLSNTTLSIPRTEKPGDTERGNPRLVTGHSRKEARGPDPRSARRADEDSLQHKGMKMLQGPCPHTHKQKKSLTS